LRFLFDTQGDHHAGHLLVGMQGAHQGDLVGQPVHIFRLADALDLEHGDLSIVDQDVNLETPLAWWTDQTDFIHYPLAQLNAVRADVWSLEGQAQRAGHHVFQLLTGSYLEPPDNQVYPVFQVINFLA